MRVLGKTIPGSALEWARKAAAGRSWIHKRDVRDYLREHLPGLMPVGRRADEELRAASRSVLAAGARAGIFVAADLVEMGGWPARRGRSYKVAREDA